MSRKPKRPAIGGLRPDGPWNATVCNYCFDLPHRRPRKPWKDPATKSYRTGCPGCNGPWMPEESEAQHAGRNAAAIEQAAWELLADQIARETAGVSSYEEAVKAVVDAIQLPNRERPEGKRARFCNYCFGMPHRRPVDEPCKGCHGAWEPEMIPIHTGLSSTMAGIPDLDSIA